MYMLSASVRIQYVTTTMEKIHFQIHVVGWVPLKDNLFYPPITIIIIIL